ncbi:MAG: DUF2148 domain-containing protein [Clostridiales Family XIII bacterium]|jgi:uncharacterized ferredoxin-like protein|nr:DUF2148 domain-containing protein [Clostridiales Family XIII bacterium]
MKYTSRDAERKAILNVAFEMTAAARTAPKGCGIDNIETVILDGEDKDALAAEMRDIHEKLGGEGPFGRDAGNVDASEAIVLIGIRNIPIGLKGCGLCGFSDCAKATQAGANCAFNVTDLGIATGSAAAVAMDNRIDNRIMFTAGKAAVNLSLFPEKVRISYGIPLSASGKSIFFDRK